MRLKLTLVPRQFPSRIPVNYQYPIQAVIYKILAAADAEYATFLHDQGYSADDTLKNFKFFTFSDLQPHMKFEKGGLWVKNEMELIVSFHLPEASERFVRGLFLNADFTIADRRYQTDFKVNLVESLPNPYQKYDAEEVIKMQLKPISPVVVGIKNAKDNYDYLSPADVRWPLAFLHHWKAKLDMLGINYKEDQLRVEVLAVDKAKKRGFHVKEGKSGATQVIGYNNFWLKLQGAVKTLEVLYNAGGGVNTSSGTGCLEIKKYQNES